MKKILFLLLIATAGFGQVKISDMTAATDLSGTVYYPIIQNGSNKRAVPYSFLAPLTISGFNVSMPVATNSIDGYLSSGDRTNFNTAYNRSGTGLTFSSSTFTFTKQDATTLTVSVPTFNQNTTGSAGSVANALTVDNSSLQLNSGTTFDGSAVKTISVKASGITNSMLAGSIDLTSKVTGTLPVANGGTGNTSLTAYAPLFGGTTSTGAIQSGTVGTTGQVLASNGSGAMPTFQDIQAVQPPELGTVYSDNFNRGSLGANWTNSGSGTFTITSNQLVVTGSSSSKLLTNYSVYSAYGTSNLESYTVTFDLIAGTISSTSFGVALNFQGVTASVQIGIGLDNAGSDLGKITYYKNNSTTGAVSSKSGMTISSGDLLKVTVRFVKDQFTTTVLDTNTNATNTSVFDCTSGYATSGFYKPNAFKVGFCALSNVSHTIDNFVFTGNDKTKATILIAGDSKVSLTTPNPSYRWGEILGREINGFVVINSGNGNAIESINGTELVNLAPQIIILDLGRNNIAAGDGSAGSLTKMATLVSTLTGGGYVVGSTLFFCLLQPETTNSSVITTYNAGLISAYGVSACFDFYTPMLTTGSTTNQFAPDAIHDSPFGHRIMAALVLNQLGLKTNVKAIGNHQPVFYSPIQTAGTTPDVTGVIIGTGNMQGISPFNTLDIVSDQNYVNVNLRANLTTDDGCYISSSGATSAIITGGAKYTGGGSWTAQNAASAGLYFFNGIGHLWSKTGATIGTTFTPVDVLTYSNTGLTVTQAALSSGFAPALSVSTGTITGGAASTEYPAFKFNGGANTAASGTTTAQRKFWVTADTYAGTSGTRTISDAYGGYFEKNIQGSNASITRNWGIGTDGNLQVQGSAYFGAATTAPTALVSLAAGTTSVAPINFTSGSLTTGGNIKAGNFEFLTDDYYATITTGTAVKKVVLADASGGLTSGKMSVATTNGRLLDANISYSSGNIAVDNGNLTLSTAGNKIFVTEGSNGSVGQTTLVSGTKAITVTGTTTSSRCFAALVSQGGTVTTTIAYTCACTSNTVTITAVDATKSTVTTDTSIVNYWIVN